MKTIKGLGTSIILLLALAFFGSVAAFLAFTAACMYDDGLPLCRHSAGGWIVIIGVQAVAVGWAGWLVRERLRRRLTRGMYVKVSSARCQRGGWFERVVKFVIEGEADEEMDHPLDLPENYGWLIPLEDGTDVTVYVDDLWRILNDAWQFQQNPENARRGALSQRRLDPQIGRPRTQAINYLVDLTGFIRHNKTTHNSIRRMTATPWRIITELFAIWPPGEVM